MTGHTF